MAKQGRYYNKVKMKMENLMIFTEVKYFHISFPNAKPIRITYHIKPIYILLFLHIGLINDLNIEND